MKSQNVMIHFRIATWMEAALLIVVGVWPVLVLGQQGQEPTPEQRVQYYNRLSETSNGRFVIDGEVVDEDGQRLNGVIVELVRSIATGLGAHHEEKLVRHTNGTFRFEEDGCAGLEMTFKLEGYYEYRVQATMPLHREALGRIMAGIAVPRQVFTKENLRVVLFPKGTPAELIKYHETLEYSTDGSGVVIDLQRSHVGHRSLVQVQNLADASRLPAHGVYIVPDLDQDGNIAVETVPRSDKPTVVDVLPKRIRLVINGTGDGLLEFTPETNAKLSLLMREAPLAGYNSELVVHAADFKDAGTMGGKIFFLRVNNLYGKGGTGPVRVSPDRRHLRLGVSLRIQPDGSRNLETLPTPKDESAIIDDAVITVEDDTAPLLTIIGDNPVTVACGAVYADAGATATDETDGDLAIAINTLNTVNTAAVGTYSVVYRVTDAAGHETTATRIVNVLYNFTGFLPPINGADATGGTVQDPVKTFKAGSKIPVKFTITCGGNAVNTGAHTLQVIKWNNETTAEEPIDASPADATTQGNAFRWADDHWQYILDTQATTMGVGTWELRATLSDGSKHSVFIGLK